MIRKAVHEDTAEITNLVHGFIRDADVTTEVSVSALWRSIFSLIINHVIFVITHNETIVGAIGLHTAADFCSSDLVATELFWYVAPEHRGKPDSIRLVLEAEQWAKRTGCKAMRLGLVYRQQNAEPLSNFYTRLGYTPLQKSFTKRLNT